MSLWQAQNLGANLSQIVAADDAQDIAILSCQRGITQPSGDGAPLGNLWANSNGAAHGFVGDALMYKRPDGTYYVLIDPAHAVLNAGGTVLPTADIPFNSKKITGLAAGTANGHAVRYQQVLKVSESTGALLADLDAGAFKVTNLAAPAGDAHAARRQDTFRSSHGRFVYNATCAQENASTPDTTSEVCAELGSGIVSFVPRFSRLRLFGDVRLQSDNSVVGNIAAAVERDVWRWNSQGGDAGTGGTVLVDTISAGAISVKVYVEWRYSPADKLGFRLRLQRASDNAPVFVDVAQQQSFYGVGM